MAKDSGKSKGEKIEIRVSNELKALVARLSRDRGSNMSSYARDLVTLDAALWTESPQIVSDALHVLFVSRHGTFTYYRREKMEVHKDVKELGVRLGMKDAKIRYFLNKPRTPLSDAWLLCAFRITEALDDKLGQRVEADPHGSISKNARFLLNDIRGPNVTIETIAVLKDYVQRSGDDAGTVVADEADFDIEVPTKKLEAIVVLDARLYEGAKRFEEASRPHLDLVLRNLNGAPFVAKTRYEQKLVKWIARGDTSSTYFAESKRRVSAIAKEVQSVLGSLVNEPHVGKAARTALKQRSDLVDFARQKVSLQRMEVAPCPPGLRLAVSWPCAPKVPAKR